MALFKYRYPHSKSILAHLADPPQASRQVYRKHKVFDVRYRRRADARMHGVLSGANRVWMACPCLRPIVSFPPSLIFTR